VRAQVTYYEFSGQHLDAAKRSAEGGPPDKVRRVPGQGLYQG